MHMLSEVLKLTAEIIAGAIILGIYLGVTISKSRKAKSARRGRLWAGGSWPSC